MKFSGKGKVKPFPLIGLLFFRARTASNWIKEPVDAISLWHFHVCMLCLRNTKEIIPFLKSFEKMDFRFRKQYYKKQILKTLIILGLPHPSSCEAKLLLCELSKYKTPNWVFVDLIHKWIFSPTNIGRNRLSYFRRGS